jgi:hypothetical protein
VWPTFYDVAQDGKRFLMLQKVAEESAPGRDATSKVRVVFNWFKEFRETQKKLPIASPGILC